MFWGCSEALDLFNEYLNAFRIKNGKNMGNGVDEIQFNKQLNILLLGASDPRHIIKTLAKLYIHKSQGKIPILNFYVIDGCVEILARNLLLLGIALENPDILNIRSKAHLFMDIYGNSLIRASSHHYLMAKAKSLRKLVTEDDYMRKLTSMLNFDNMKYRERDNLENVFNFWLSKQNEFKMQEYWNARVRQSLGIRFDYRKGQFDWDLNMVLKERGGAQICTQEYNFWRETGIAFTFPEYEYSKPNKTFAAGVTRNGDTFVHFNYVGDIKTGPFPAFGLGTDDKRMLKSFHGKNDYRSTDVTERNLMELLHELTYQSTYEHDISQSCKYGAVALKMSLHNYEHREYDTENAKEYDKPWCAVDGIKIYFMSSLPQSCSSQWSRFFDIAFVGHHYFTFLQDTFFNVLRQQSLLITETKLLSTFPKDNIINFEQKLINFAQRNNFKGVINYKTQNSKNSILKFKSSADTEYI